MNKKTLTLLLLASITLLSVAGVKVSKLTRTTSFASNDLFIVVTGSTTKVTRHIRASDLAVGLGPWITNSGGGASSVTNAISVVRSNGTAISSAATSLDFIEGTNVTLRATNAAGVVTVQINASGGGSVDPTNAVLANIIGTGAVTNKFNRWSFWVSPTDTNSFFAENRGLGIVTNSTDFGALLQSVLNRGTDGFHFQLFGNPYYTAHYVVSNTVVFTNWGTIRGDGNPSTVIRGKSGMSTAVLQFGDSTHFISGISRVEELRMEGEGTSAGSVGVHVVNTAEPVFHKVEWTGFLMAGLRISTLYNTAWAEADNCWFVQKGVNAHGILFDASPVTSIGQNHFSIKNCIFGNHTSGGTAITVSNWFPGIVVEGCHFRNYPSVGGEGIYLYAGADSTIQGNQFLGFSGTFGIVFNDRASTTNYSSSVVDNIGWTHSVDAGASEVVYIGENVQGVFTSGNMARGATAGVITSGVGNGPLNNFDKYELRIGSLPITNRVLYADASGIVKPVSSSSPSTEYVKADGTAGTPSGSGSLVTNANQFGASLTLTIKDGALLTNTSIRTALTLPTLTVSRAAVLNSSGQLTNSAAVSDVELEYLDGVTSAIQTQLGTKTALATNASQFGASTVLTIADRASLTNINVYGTGVVFSGHVTVSSNITASSFIGSGTGTPYLLLSSANGAAFALSVNTNLTVQTTNKFDFSSVSAAQVISAHSSSAGQIVWTNATVAGGGGNPGATIEDHFMGGGTGSGAVGELSWSFSAAATSYAGSDGHPGIFQFSGNVSGTVYYLYTGIGDVTSSGNLASLAWTNTIVTRIGNATSLTNSTFRFGWANDLTSAGPAHMIALNCTNGTTPGTWFATVASNSVLSSLTTSITATTGWITNEVRSTGASNITFVVNGTALSAIPFCPSVGMRAFFQVIPSEASSKLAEVDFWRFRPSLGY